MKIIRCWWAALQNYRAICCNFFASVYIELAYRRLRRNFAAKFCNWTDRLFSISRYSALLGNTSVRKDFVYEGHGLAKEELITMEGAIDEVLPDGRFGVTLDNEHRIIAYTAGKMRRYRIRSVVGDRVHVELTPYDLTKGRIVFRERTPGQATPGGRKRGFRR